MVEDVEDPKGFQKLAPSLLKRNSCLQEKKTAAAAAEQQRRPPTAVALRSLQAFCRPEEVQHQRSPDLIDRMSKIELKIDAGGVVGVDASIVNGKQDMGFRKLVVSHVENATTLYAYTEEDAEQVSYRSLLTIYLVSPFENDNPMAYYSSCKTVVKIVNRRKISLRT